MLSVNKDKVADAVYVRIKDEPVAYSRELDRNRIIDYAEDGTPVGVDLLAVSQGIDFADLPYAEEIRAALEGQDRNGA